MRGVASPRTEITALYPKKSLHLAFVTDRKALLDVGGDMSLVVREAITVSGNLHTFLGVGAGMAWRKNWAGRLTTEQSR